VGATVQVEAYRLTDVQHNPLQEPEVALHVSDPDHTVHTVNLKLDPTRAAMGTYAGQFTLLREGPHVIELELPDADRPLRKTIRARFVGLEKVNPQRDDATLSRLARATGGEYFIGLDAILDTGEKDVTAKLSDRTLTIPTTAAPSEDWERKWLRWVMVLVCALLCFEWLIRRLVRLA
jgi:hypothetical protein